MPPRKEMRGYTGDRARDTSPFRLMLAEIVLQPILATDKELHIVD